MLSFRVPSLLCSFSRLSRCRYGISSPTRPTTHLVPLSSRAGVLLTCRPHRGLMSSFLKHSRIVATRVSVGRTTKRGARKCLSFVFHFTVLFYFAHGHHYFGRSTYFYVLSACAVMLRSHCRILLPSWHLLLVDWPAPRYLVKLKKHTEGLPKLTVCINMYSFCNAGQTTVAAHKAATP